MPEDVLEPSNSWGNKKEYWQTYDGLAARFIENFKLFAKDCSEEVIESRTEEVEEIIYLLRDGLLTRLIFVQCRIEIMNQILVKLFQRDLEKLKTEITSYKDEKKMWEVSGEYKKLRRKFMSTHLRQPSAFYWFSSW